MSFWDLEDQNEKLPSDGNFETGGGDMEPIPANTSVLAVADEAKWDEYNDCNFISVRWSVLSPKEYKNRKVFQKLWVGDDDPSAKDPKKKRDKAKRMLAAIDANAGGKLVASGEAPTDENMTRFLVNKPMVLKLQVWELDDKSKAGNWVSAVSPRKSGVEAPAKEEPKAAPVEEDDGDSIPF